MKAAPRTCKPQRKRTPPDNKVYLTLGGIRLTIAEWAKRANLSVPTINMRIQRGWNAEEILLTPAGQKYPSRESERQAYQGSAFVATRKGD